MILMLQRYKNRKT